MTKKEKIVELCNRYEKEKLMAKYGIGEYQDNFLFIKVISALALFKFFFL